MVEKMKMFFNKRIMNYVFGSVRCRERNCDYKVSGDKTKQRKNEKFASPARQQGFKHRASSVLILLFSITAARINFSPNKKARSTSGNAPFTVKIPCPSFLACGVSWRAGSKEVFRIMLRPKRLVPPWLFFTKSSAINFQQKLGYKEMYINCG